MEMRLVFRVFAHKSKGSDATGLRYSGGAAWKSDRGVVATRRREGVLIENVTICPGPGWQEVAGRICHLAATSATSGCPCAPCAVVK